MKQQLKALVKCAKILPALGLILAAFAGFYWKSTGGPAAAPIVQTDSPRTPHSTPPLQSDYFKTQFHNESEFIVQSIVTDIAEMAVYAKSHTAPATNSEMVALREDLTAPANAPRYKLEIKLPLKNLNCDLDIDPAHGTIWSPETYAGITRQIFNSLGLNAVSNTVQKTADIFFLNSLLSPNAQVIESANIHLSGELADDFSSPVLHEKAALLLGTFALRENSGCFYEIRFPLCRMTAHLALVKAFGNDSAYDVNGRVAEALLYTLMNNEKQALAKTALIGQEQPALAPWTRILKVRNTHDYRPLAALTNRSPLETIEYFRAYCDNVDPDLAWRKLTALQQESIPDFCRIVDASPDGHSVGLGHVMLATHLQLELKEELQVLQLSNHMQKPNPQEFLNAMNEMPDRCVRLNSDGTSAIHVIGWGQWAAFFQRHLCQTIVRDYHFMQDSWGVPEDAKKFAEECDKTFSGLRLYPFVQKVDSHDERSYRSAVDDSLKVIRSTPQLVGAEIWNQLYYSVPFAALYQPDPRSRVEEWHSHNPPPGTAYNPYPRMGHENLVKRPDSVSRLQELYELSPYDMDIQYSYAVSKYGGHANYDQTEAIFHPVLDYNSHQLYFLAEKATNDPAIYVPTMERCAEMDPARYYALAEYLINRGQEDKAIPFIEKGMDLFPDSVTKAAYAGRMIKHYVKQGQISKASALADFAADVYSADGLEAKAEFLESQNKYREALDYYQKIEERYEDSSPLVSFCTRYKAATGKSDLDEILARRIKKVFPRGMEKTSLAEFNTPPRDGIIVGGENETTAKAGIAHGNIIVAINGVRIHNFDQYLYIRGLDTAPELHLIVWQANKYREITAAPPDHRFGVDMPDYLTN
jgi:tetratricopeptide (TPR) repeat protein